MAWNSRAPEGVLRIQPFGCSDLSNKGICGSENPRCLSPFENGAFTIADEPGFALMIHPHGGDAAEGREVAGGC